VTEQAPKRSHSNPPIVLTRRWVITKNPRATRPGNIKYWSKRATRRESLFNVAHSVGKKHGHITSPSTYPVLDILFQTATFLLNNFSRSRQKECKPSLLNAALIEIPRASFSMARRRIISTLVHETRGRTDPDLPPTLAMFQTTWYHSTNCSGLGPVRGWYWCVIPHRRNHRLASHGIQVAQIRTTLPIHH
jgi:hypothetical protein